MAQPFLIQPQVPAEPQISLNQNAGQPETPFSPHLENAINRQQSSSPKTTSTHKNQGAEREYAKRQDPNQQLAEEPNSNTIPTDNHQQSTITAKNENAGTTDSVENIEVTPSSEKAIDTPVSANQSPQHVSTPLQLVATSNLQENRAGDPVVPIIQKGLTNETVPSELRQQDAFTIQVSKAALFAELSVATNNSTTSAQFQAASIQVTASGEGNNLSSGIKAANLEQSILQLLGNGKAANENVKGQQTPLVFSGAAAGESVHTTGSTPDPLVGQNIYNRQTENLLNRLDRIIQASSELGTVSITKKPIGEGVQNNLVSPPISTQNSATPLNEQMASLRGQQTAQILSQQTNDTAKVIDARMVIDGNKDFTVVPPTKLNQELPSLRQDTQQQYFDAKLGSDKITAENQNSGKQQQDNDFAGTGQNNRDNSSISFASTNEKGAFSLSGVQTTENTVTQVTEAARPIILPSGTMVQEQEVLQQLIERFQISRRQLDSRINLKLHPAELGEMKIDLTVKEGAIRANVIAQTQVVQEILEKNLAKLRNALENQGYTIEEITFTTESDSVGEFNLFDEQLASNNSYKETPRKNTTGFDSFMESELLDEQQEDVEVSGVNIRA